MASFLEVLFNKAECITNAYAVEEARRNLVLKAPRGIERFGALLGECELVGGIITETELALNLKDAPILGGAIAGKATHLLTGDERDFGSFFGKIIHGVKIVSPRLLAEEVARLGWIKKERT